MITIIHTWRLERKGYVARSWGKHPRIQLFTVGELLYGKTVDYPRVAGANQIFRAASRAPVAKDAVALPLRGHMAPEADYVPGRKVKKLPKRDK
jgi:hypothetical protein